MFPSALPQDYSATRLNDVQKWDSAAEIKYNTTQGRYYSDKQKPTGGLATTAFHVLNRTEDDRAAHRAAIGQLVKEVSHTNPQLGTNLKDRFSLRRLLGQPVTPDSINSFFKDSSQGTVYGALKDLQRGIVNMFPPASHGFKYEPILDPGDPHTRTSPLHSPTSPRTTSATSSSYGAIDSRQGKDEIFPPAQQNTISPSDTSHHSYQKEGPKPPPTHKKSTSLPAPTKPPSPVTSSVLERYYQRKGLNKTSTFKRTERN